MKRSVIFGLLGTTLLTGCGDPNQLDRDEAHSLILSATSARLPDDGCLALRPGGYEAGIDQGYWSQWWVTETGQPTFKSVNRERVCLHEKLGTNPDITGIADAELPGYKDIEFYLSNASIPDPARRFIVSGYRGRATARRYDDGWRIEGNVRYQRDNTPLPLDDKAEAALQKDAYQEAKRQEEVAAYDAERQAAFDQKIEASRMAKVTDKGFTCDVVIGDRRNSFYLWANDVRIKLIRKTFDQIGNGGVTGTTTYLYGHIPSLKTEKEWLMFEQKSAGSGTNFQYFYPKECQNFREVEAVVRGFHAKWWENYGEVGEQQ